MIPRGAQGGQAVLVDPKGDDYSLYKGATMVTPNLKSCARWSAAEGREDLEARAQRLRAELRLEALLLTRGEDGMTVFRNRKIFHVKAESARCPTSRALATR